MVWPYEKSVWTDERTEQLRTLLAEGKTASDVAAVLGVSRNSVISKAHRKGFPLDAPNNGGWHRGTATDRAEMRATASRKNPIVPKPRHRSNNPNNAMFRPRGEFKPQPRPVVVSTVPIQPSLNLTLLEMHDNDCHWIVNEGRPALYCGNPVEQLRAYCPGHARIVFQPLTTRQERGDRHLAASIP